MPPILLVMQYVTNLILQYFIIYLTMVGSELTYASGSTAGLTPMFTEKSMSKVNPSLPCVMNVSMRYFIIYTVLALARMTNQLTNNIRVGEQNTLETACTASMILQTLLVITSIYCVQ